jgi:L-seryl-tRNA(Ser) seleniumtransferase
VADSISAGVNVLSFSCDKLLGGPQTGIIAGDTELVARIRRSPMYRALRVDKLIVQALQTTLLHLVRKDWQKLPALRMILATPEEIRKRAEQLSAMLEGIDHALGQSASKIGGGSTPNYELSSWAIVLRVKNAAAFEKRLRRGQLPVIARIEHDQVLFDLRTVSDGELESLAAAIRAASEN